MAARLIHVALLFLSMAMPAQGKGGELSQRSGRPAGNTVAGWVKCRDNPVLGGGLGTCFDVSLLHEDGKFRMWFSWRPKRSLTLVESGDGIHWSKPEIVLAPNPKTDWEADINRPVVLHHGEVYHLWYTGQARGRSWIGYATSRDGITGWQRHPSNPIIAPTQGQWDQDACYKPFAAADRGRWLLWYNGRSGSVEQIGLAVHDGEDLGF